MLGISYADIADEYMLFIDSDYDELLKKAIEIEGVPSSKFAEMHGLEYTTFRHSLNRMHKLSPETAEKYRKVLKQYGLWQ